MVQRKVILLVFLLAACGAAKDMTGREITELDEQAVETCNRLLEREMRGTIGNIVASEAVIDRSVQNRIDIAWTAKTKVGSGPVLCSTDLMALKVVRLQIDGIEVNVGR